MIIGMLVGAGIMLAGVVLGLFLGAALAFGSQKRNNDELYG